MMHKEWGASPEYGEWFDGLPASEQLVVLRELLQDIGRERGWQYVKKIIRMFDVEKLSQIPVEDYEELLEVLYAC
ncbi:MAG: hypothetical protein ABF778_07185 [Liquorilactobacillus hordei]|uniref:hypothetical protein n=1 Tax=Liquorilactobacillus hordei TaxID=468911 RepID=UPI0039E74A35